MVNFIGLGAQKSGTSWIYANLYEHPEICIPIKETHFFSRDRFSKGKEWYEAHFRKCGADKKCGEFSTSYLYSEDAPARIHSLYSDAKLIAVLREPVSRAYSQYRNAIKAGEINEGVSFDEYIEREPSALAQGMYAAQLVRYLELFLRSKLLVLIYEDIAKDPQKFMERVYRFLEVDPTFVSSMLHTPVNTARTPRTVFLDRVMHWVAEALRRIGLDRLVHAVRKTGLTDTVRTLNTKSRGENSRQPFDRSRYVTHFSADVRQLGEIAGRDLAKEWNIPV